MQNIQIIHHNSDKTVLGIADNKVYKGTPVEIPITELEVEEKPIKIVLVDRGGNGKDKVVDGIERTRHYKGQIYSQAQFTNEALTQEIENDQENVAKMLNPDGSIMKDGDGKPIAKPDVSRSYDESSEHITLMKRNRAPTKHTFFDWEELS